MTTVTEKVQPITITSAAADNVHQLLTDRELTDHCLRIYVAGIGCAGPQYGLAFDNAPRETDTVVETNHLKVLIDPDSLVYLEGATIDYIETPLGAGFKIENPNTLAGAACRTCPGACG